MVFRKGARSLPQSIGSSSLIPDYTRKKSLCLLNTLFHIYLSIYSFQRENNL